MEAAAASNEGSGSTMNNLKHFVLSHFLKSNPSINTDHVSSYIQQRLPQIYPSVDIPSHLPYALMIENAIKGLDERNGLTEEAISDFIKKEYKDLPMAHGRILRFQLKKLCEGGELVCKEGGRYVFAVDDVGIIDDDDGKDEEWMGSKKRKRDKKKNNEGKREKRGRMMEKFDGVEKRNGLEEEGIKERNQVPETHDARIDDEPSRVAAGCIEEEQVDEEENLLTEKVEEQGRAEKGMSGDGEGKGSTKRKRGRKKNNDGKRKKGGRKERLDGVNEQSRASELPDARNDEPSRVVEEEENRLVEQIEEQGQAEKVVIEVVGKLSLSECQETRVIEQQAEAEAPAQSEGGKPQSNEVVVECLEEQVEEEGDPLIEKVEEQGQAEKGVFGKQSQSECQETGVIEQHGEAEVQAQIEGEKSRVSQIQNFTVDSQKPLLAPISEGFPKGIPSSGIEQDENPLSGDPKQKPPKYPKGRPRKPEDQAQHCGQGRGRGKGRGRGRGRGRRQRRPPKLCRDTDQCEEWLQQEYREAEAQSECQETEVIERHAGVEAPTQSEGEKSQISQMQVPVDSQQTAPKVPVDSQQPLLAAILEGFPKGMPSAGIEQDENPLSGDPEQKPPKRPRGRPRKPYFTAYQLKNPLQVEDQAQRSGQGRHRGTGEGRRRGRGRDQTRPPTLSHDTNECEEQLQQEYREQQHGSGKGRGGGRGRGRPPKLSHDTDQCEEQLQEDQEQQHSSGKGRGSGRGLGRPPKLSHDTDQCEEQLQQEDRAQQRGSGRGRGRGRGSGRGRGRGRGWGRPGKLDQNANQSEEHLSPQDQAPSLLQLLPHIKQGEWQTCERLSMENALNSLSDANQTLQQLRPELCEVEGDPQNEYLGQDMPS